MNSEQIFHMTNISIYPETPGKMGVFFVVVITMCKMCKVYGRISKNSFYINSQNFCTFCTLLKIYNMISDKMGVFSISKNIENM